MPPLKCRVLSVIFPLTFASYFVYVLFLLTLLVYHKSHFNYSFYTICVSEGVGDLLGMFVTNVLFKYPMCLWFPLFDITTFVRHHWLNWLAVAGTFYLGHVQGLGVLLMGVNRLTAISLPLKHEKWLMPFVLSSPLAYTDIVGAVECKHNRTEHRKTYKNDCPGLIVGYVPEFTEPLMYLMPPLKCRVLSVIFPLTFASYFVYVLFLLTLLVYHKSHFNYSFYIICVSEGVGDLLGMFVTNVLFKYPMCLWFPLFDITTFVRHHWLNWLAVAGTFYLGHVQGLGVLMMAVNRLTAISSPLKHEKIWSNNMVVLAICLQWLMPFVLSSPLAYTDIVGAVECKHNRTEHRKTYKNDCPGLIVGYVPEFTEPLMYLLTWIIATAFTGIGLNIIITSMYIKIFSDLSKSTDDSSRARRARAHVKLTITGFIIFLCLSVSGLFMILMTLAELKVLPGKDTFLAIYYVIGDVYSWINPYLVLGASLTARQQLIQLITFGRYGGQPDPS